MAATNVPNATPIVLVNGRIASAGYQPQFGLCFCWVDEAPKAWLISADGKDFSPAIALRSDGMIVVATGENSGETVARKYVIDPLTMICSRNGGQPWSLQKIDLFNPPVELPRFKHGIYVGSYFPSR